MKTGKPARPTRRSPRLAVAVNNDDDNNDIDDARVSDHSPRRAEQDDGQGDGSHEDAPPHQRDENNDVVTHNDDELAARVPAIANDELDDNAGNNDAGHVHHGDDDGTEIEGEESPSINTQVTDTVATSIATMAMALQQLTTMCRRSTRTKVTTSSTDEDCRNVTAAGTATKFEAQYSSPWVAVT
ncbi:hypothetical protein PF002_g20330 [Phytophthora fragariae]|uniref:Uncharacterized protein n=1 Tax=Phytophthora fragariae TaxID=53985 RepID=A0A6A3XMZ4_9STRA|nr:hypothetical protein PF002_g20330 [Phytophthora fragariae]